MSCVSGSGYKTKACVLLPRGSSLEKPVAYGEEKERKESEDAGKAQEESEGRRG